MKELDNNIEPNSYSVKIIENKKNRTLQFFKFLLNSMKMEISLNEFMKLIKMSNQGEIGLWIISIFLYYSGNYEFPLVWLHILHLIRGFLGVSIFFKLPRSYELIDSIDVEGKLMENKVFNDLMRDSAKQHILPLIQNLKVYLLAYFSLTFVNFMIDIVDFLYLLSNINSTQINSSVIVVFLMIDIIYLSIY